MEYRGDPEAASTNVTLSELYVPCKIIQTPLPNGKAKHSQETKAYDF